MTTFKRLLLLVPMLLFLLPSASASAAPAGISSLFSQSSIAVRPRASPGSAAR